VKTFDLIVIGAGPAGSTCAALCAEAGMKVLLLDSTLFPRDKVCGDCLNPAAWPVLDRLGISSRVRALPSSSPKRIRFSVAGHEALEFPLSESPGEVVVRRRELDEVIVDRAVALGATFQDGAPVTGLRKSKSFWEVSTALKTVGRTRRIVAADGRNSSVGRLLRMFSRPLGDQRIGLQTHIAHPIGYDGALEMHFYGNGYGGLADLGNGLANLCLVANAGKMRELRKEAEARYHVDPAIAWRSITPISRPTARHVARDGVFLCGDAARVVEPFTGQGIAFALRAATLLAEILVTHPKPAPGIAEKTYTNAHRRLYRGRLWINHLMRFFSRHPGITHTVAPVLLRYPKLLLMMMDNVLRKNT
jgi:flavin-dependent dehydrogenase